MARVGFGVFAAMSLLIALVSLRSLTMSIAQSMPHVAHFLAATPWGLWVHLVAGPLVLALAPLQLWTGLRGIAPRLHRWSGRLYAVAVLVAAPAGFVLAASGVSQASVFARTGFIVMAVLWVLTTAKGVWWVRKGDYARHRWWMQRSLAVTFGAVTLRVVMGPLMAMGWPLPQTYDVTAWGSWLFNLAVLELWQRRRVLRPA